MLPRSSAITVRMRGVRGLRVAATAAASSRPASIAVSRALSTTPRLFIAPTPRLFTTPTAPRLSSQPSTPTRPCPACTTPIPLPASPCPSCGALVPIPLDLSLHSVLGLSDPIPAPEDMGHNPGGDFDIAAELATLPSHGFVLDVPALRLAMLRRQASLHPDRNRESDLAAALSARVNRAYEVLANPQSRAEYILSQFGHDTKETEHVADHDLLMEILDARETLEEATADEVEQLREENQAKVDDVSAAIADALATEPPDFARAKELAVELKYWVGLELAARERL
ncbi:hypothetical protein CspeluHIS016_0305180 [Cutaneotrichosporon spelunceum]|uniref:J domain-containing protein n=1 Tax=Cutaneotrichosporon spelunceum TaxID=1672016 RepID=A0AAD3YC21_9TREE|nr:hypothetical protein CspeluHIS016_0305180 [Cutaneotrichosporon spelunceum]